MNKKVVVFWVFLIVLFSIIGLYGLLNKNLLVDEAINKEYVPKKISENMKSCTKTFNDEKIKYDFVFDSNGNVLKIMMTYTGKSENISNFEVASTINNLKLNGIKSTLSGGSVDFVLLVTATVNDIDYNVFDNYKSNFEKLGMFIDRKVTYKDYINYIKGIDTAFVCE